MNELALFAGAGGGILGGKLLGWKCVCAVEYEPAARRMLAARQDDGCLDPFPIWDDVRTFDGKPWRGLVDVVSGGFPCQDISAAGKGAWLDGERSGLWSEMSRIIGEVRPRFALVENSPVLTSRGLGTVLGDLAAMGYDARWGVLGAIDAGAPHKRDRIWIVGHANSIDRRAGTGRKDGKKTRHKSGNVADASGAQDHAKRGDCECGRDAMERHNQAAQQDLGAPDHDGSCGCGGTMADTNGLRELQPQGSEQKQRGWAGYGGATVSDTNGSGCQEQRCSVANDEEHEAAECRGWWSTEPDVGRVAHGVASRVDRLRCLGNGQVPAVAALAWKILTQSTPSPK
jgi:DNA (cytosine-5)-methyltransferase 1